MKGKLQAFAVAVVGVTALVLAQTCRKPADPPAPAVVTPPPPLKAVAKAKTRVVIERPVASAQASSTQPIERIVIESDAEAEAKVEPTAPPHVLHTPLPVLMAERPNHTRIGVVAGTFPGLLALDVQILRGYPLTPLANWSVLPPEVKTLELSLDLEFNSHQAGLSLAAGDKLFGSVGYFGSWTELSHGPFIGIGMRF